MGAHQKCLGAMEKIITELSNTPPQPSLWAVMWEFVSDAYMESKGSDYPLILAVWSMSLLSLVLLNPDMRCLYKQCRSRSVGFFRSQLIWIYIVIKYVNCIKILDQVIRLAENYKRMWHLNSFSMTRVNCWQSRMKRYCRMSKLRTKTLMNINKFISLVG